MSQESNQPHATAPEIVIHAALTMLLAPAISAEEAGQFTVNGSSMFHPTGRLATPAEIHQCHRFYCCEELKIENPASLTLMDCIGWIVIGASEPEMVVPNMENVMARVGVTF